MNNSNLEGETVTIKGKVTEHLILGKKQWVTVELPGHKKVTLKAEDCSWNFWVNLNANTQF